MIGGDAIAEEERVFLGESLVQAALMLFRQVALLILQGELNRHWELHTSPRS